MEQTLKKLFFNNNFQKLKNKTYKPTNCKTLNERENKLRTLHINTPFPTMSIFFLFLNLWFPPNNFSRASFFYGILYNKILP